MNKMVEFVSHRIGRRQFMQLCAGTLALSAAGCRRTGDPAYKRGSTLIIAVSDVNQILPDATDLDLMVFLPLAKMSDTGDFEPWLAESWKHSPDYLEWTYHLRKNVRWNDGVPVTVDDVKFSLTLWAQVAGPASFSSFSFDDIRVVDQYTLKVRCGQVYQDQVRIWPKHLLERLDPNKFVEWNFWLHPVGDGPYRFVRYVPETMIEFEANPDYFRGRRTIDRVIVKFAASAGLSELLSGNVDVVLDADPTQVHALANDSRFRVYYSVGAGSLAIRWKCDHPLFRDPRVRRALTLAIDRRELLRFSNLPEDLPMNDGVITERQVRRHQFPEPIPYDPRAASELLEATGWHARTSDGLRERGGRPFRFTLVTPNRLWGADSVAVYIQAMLRQVGVQMDVQVLDNNFVWTKIERGEFEAIFAPHTGGDSPRDERAGFVRGNPSAYENSEAIRLIDRAVATPNPNELDHIYAELNQILRNDLPITSVLPENYACFVHRRVHGLSTPFHADLGSDLEDLWLEN